jgi:hypothetical protein
VSMWRMRQTRKRPTPIFARNTKSLSLGPLGVAFSDLLPEF